MVYSVNFYTNFGTWQGPAGGFSGGGKEEGECGATLPAVVDQIELEGRARILRTYLAAYLMLDASGLAEHSDELLCQCIGDYLAHVGDIEDSAFPCGIC